jgi:hypothetical protein
MKVLIASVAVLAAYVTSAAAQAPSPATNISGTGQFCLSGSGNANCIYESMALCETAKRTVNSSAECVDRTKVIGATGSGSSSTPAATPPAGSPPK